MTQSRTHEATRRLLFLGFVIGAFALGTSENVVAGILPDIARGLHVSEGSAGLLVTAYAGTVTVAGPIVTLFLDRVGPKKLVTGAIALYLAGSLLAAAGGSFAMVVAGRVVTGLVHTTIMVVFMTAAMRVAEPGKEASAAANITLGLSVATVLGVPIGVFLGQHLAWQASFWLVAVLAAVSLLVVLAAFPADERPGAGSAGDGAPRAGLRALGRPELVIGICVTALTGMAALTVVTYVAPFLTQGSGVASGLIVWIMLAYGAGCVIGNTLGGRLANGRVLQAMVGTVTATLAVLAVLLLVSGSAVPTVIVTVLLGLAYFATFPALNTWVASNSQGISPNLALALNSSAFNIGIALAGWTGSAWLDSDRPIENLPLIALAPAVLAAALAWVLVRRRRTGSGQAAPGQDPAGEAHAGSPATA
ncbi:MULTISPECIES: MFS transporter [unclassified Streptomyces]|uniref:MFS transporter n=1 Tax=unclassified Streptomyces TaxID=2593676 RepID=UPI0033B1D5F4